MIGATANVHPFRDSALTLSPVAIRSRAHTEYAGRIVTSQTGIVPFAPKKTHTPDNMDLGAFVSHAKRVLTP